VFAIWTKDKKKSFQQCIVRKKNAEAELHYNWITMHMSNSKINI